MIRYSLLLFFLAISSVKAADNLVTPNLFKVRENLYNLNFSQARNLLNSEPKSSPLACSLEDYTDFLEIFISEDFKEFQKYKDSKESRLTRLDDLNDEDPFKRFAIADIHLHSGFLKFKFGDYASAAYEIHKAYRLLLKNIELFPEYKASYKSLSFLHALIGSIPPDYKWIAGIVGMKGTLQQAAEELEIFKKSSDPVSSFYKYDGYFFGLCQQLYFFKNHTAALKELEIIKNTEIGQSPLIAFFYGSAYLPLGENERAKNLLKNLPPGDYNKLPYLNYLRGITELNAQENQSSEWFLKYVSQFKGSSFIKAAYQKIAWDHLIHDDGTGYTEFIKLCTTRGKAVIDEDVQAEKEGSEGNQPNVLLLKARLYFDGGYYLKALQVLAINANKLSSLKDKVEYTYRLARVYHKSGNPSKAVAIYQKIIDTYSNLHYYFAANSALELGMLYESQKNPEKAKEYFQKCLSMRDHEYQKSLDQKAKAGLNRLGVY